MGKKYFTKTIVAIILLTILISSVHYANHFTIQELEYTEKWGEEVTIDKIGQKDKSLLSSVDDKIINLSIGNKNELKFQILNTTGEIEEEGTTKIDNYENIKTKNLQFVEDNLIYLYNNDIYLAKFEKNTFSKTKKIIENVDEMDLEYFDNRILVSAVNKDEIRVFEIKKNKVTNIYKEENNLNFINGRYLEVEGNEYIVGITEEGYDIQKLIMKPINLDNKELLTIKEVNSYSGYRIKDINIDYLDGKVIITYILNLSSKGMQTYEIEYSEINLNTMNLNSNKLSFSEYGVGRLDSDIDTYIYNGDLHIVGSGLNYNNKYTDVNDLFDFTVDEKGEVKELEFISTTQKYSNEFNIVTLEDNIYISFKDVIAGGYHVRIIGNSKEFIDQKDISTSDYIDALLKSIPSPFIASGYALLRTLIMFVMMIVPLFLAYVLYLSKNNDNEHIKTGIMIGIYAITNIIAFKFLFFKIGQNPYYPEIFYNSFFGIVAPIIINLLSAIALLVFIKESKKKNKDFSYAVFAVFFIGLDIYLNNLLYAPFVLVGKLISM